MSKTIYAAIDGNYKVQTTDGYIYSTVVYPCNADLTTLTSEENAAISDDDLDRLYSFQSAADHLLNTYATWLTVCSRGYLEPQFDTAEAMDQWDNLMQQIDSWSSEVISND